MVTNKSTGYTVAIHEKTILGVFNNDHDVSLGLYSLSSKKIIVSRGLIKEEWINRIDKNQQAKFVDDDSFVVMQKSKDLDFVSVAAIPVNSVNQGLYEIAAILVPIGIFSGGLLALAVGSRTIGCLKTSVRCCMAERYCKQFWQHGNPVPRSCHADQPS